MPFKFWWERMDSNHRSKCNRFTVCPLWPLGNSPKINLWSWWTDSNPRPADYKSAALPTELHQLIPAAATLISIPQLQKLVNTFLSDLHIFLRSIRQLNYCTPIFLKCQALNVFLSTYTIKHIYIAHILCTIHAICCESVQIILQNYFYT